MAAVQRKARIRRALAGVAILVATGYASSFASTEQCEANAANAIARGLGSRDVYLLPVDGSANEDYRGAEAILPKVGFRIRPCVSEIGRFDCFPWAGVAQAQVVGPFLVDMRWGYVAAPTSGRGSRTRYVAIFGAVFPVSDVGGWVT